MYTYSCITAIQHLDLTKERKKTMEHKSDGGTNCNWSDWNDTQRGGKGVAGWLWNKKISRNHVDYSIYKTGQNTRKTVLGTWGDLLPFKFRGKTSPLASVKQEKETLREKQNLS